MRMRTTLMLAAGALCALPAFAADFGVMETADTVRPHDFKLIGFPMAIRSGERGDEERGFSGGLGYGILPNLDIEAHVASFSDITYYGGNSEYMFYGGHHVTVSAVSGAHYAHSDFGNLWGLGFTSIGSYALPALPKLKFNGAISLAWDKPDLNAAQAIDNNDPYYSAYAVPGVQYRLVRDLDLIGEVGVGLNHDSSDYASAGISYYFR